MYEKEFNKNEKCIYFGRMLRYRNNTMMPSNDQRMMAYRTNTMKESTVTKVMRRGKTITINIIDHGVVDIVNTSVRNASRIKY